MQEKTITIPFNRNSYLHKQKAVWMLIQKEVLGSYIIYSVVTIIVIVCAYFIDSRGGMPLLSIIALIMLISILTKYRELYLARKRFYGKARYTANKNEQENAYQTYTFSDEGLGYKDLHRRMQLSWVLFEPVEHFKKNLILRLTEDGQIFMMLSTDDIDYTSFEEIMEILKEKTAVNN
jgi:hypothetical protein